MSTVVRIAEQQIALVLTDYAGCGEFLGSAFLPADVVAGRREA
jgi:hypothetical protein